MILILLSAVAKSVLSCTKQIIKQKIRNKLREVS